VIIYEFDDHGSFHVTPRLLGITEDDQVAILTAVYPTPAYNMLIEQLSQRLVEFFDMPTQGSC